MNKFRVTTPVSKIKNNQKEEMKRFTEEADQHEVSRIELNKTDKPTKSFTIPVNDFELDLLRRAAKKDNRSQRYIGRLLLVKAMQEYIRE